MTLKRVTKIIATVCIGLPIFVFADQDLDKLSLVKIDNSDGNTSIESVTQRYVKPLLLSDQVASCSDLNTFDFSNRPMGDAAQLFGFGPQASSDKFGLVYFKSNWSFGESISNFDLIRQLNNVLTFQGRTVDGIRYILRVDTKRSRLSLTKGAKMDLIARDCDFTSLMEVID